MLTKFIVPEPDASYWKALDRFSPLEREVMEHILLTGYSHASVLRVAFLTNRFRINEVLRNLWLVGYIHRDVKGLVISTHHTKHLPHFREWLQQQFKVTLT